MSTHVSTQAEAIQCEADGFEFEAVPGRTLMQALKDTGFDIEASCEGCLVCATCHVVLAPEWYERLGPPAADEQALLDCLAVTSPTSRLSCQIVLAPEMHGLSVEIPR